MLDYDKRGNFADDSSTYTGKRSARIDESSRFHRYRYELSQFSWRCEIWQIKSSRSCVSNFHSCSSKPEFGRAQLLCKSRKCWIRCQNRGAHSEQFSFRRWRWDVFTCFYILIFWRVPAWGNIAFSTCYSTISKTFFPWTEVNIREVTMAYSAIGISKGSILRRMIFF